MLRQKADLFGYLLDLGHSFLLVLIKVEVDKALGYDILYRRTLVKRGRRILEYHLYLADNLFILSL